MSEGKFIECNGCRKKLGSPTLCDGCLHNRRDITRLNADNRELKTILADNQAHGKGMQAACDQQRVEIKRLQAGIEAVFHEVAAVAGIDALEKITKAAMAAVDANG